MKKILVNEYFILILFGLATTFPHFFTSIDIWDGTILRYAIENRNYEVLDSFFSETNISAFVLIYYIILFIYQFSGIDLSIVLNIFTLLITTISVVSFYFFLVNALKIDKQTSLVTSTFSLFLPYYALLNSSFFFFSILTPSLILFSIGLFYKNKLYLKITALIILCYISMYPLFLSFSFFLITISIINNNINLFNFSKLNKYFPLYFSLLLGTIFYSYTYNKFVAPEYKAYLDFENIKYGFLMFHEYLKFFYVCLVIPVFLFIIRFLKNPVYVSVLFAVCLCLMLIALAPYAAFNKQPICQVDYNCKENIYDFKERHAIPLFVALMIFISIGLNFLNAMSSNLKSFFLILSSLIFIYVLLPYYVLSHNKNIIRQDWMNGLQKAILDIPEQFNYIQILMPNDNVLYRLRNYDIQYLAHRIGIRNRIFQVLLVDNRVIDKTHKDYFIVPNQPIFSLRVKEVESLIEKEGILGLVERGFVKNLKKPICAARYIILNKKIPSQNYPANDYFNMRLNNINIWQVPYKIEKLEINLKKIEETCDNIS